MTKKQHRNYIKLLIFELKKEFSNLKIVSEIQSKADNNWKSEGQDGYFLSF